jgi:inorganic pyrophosphatase
MTEGHFWSRLASLVAGATVVVDRPKGTAHPTIPSLIYPLDYGYLSGTQSGDGHAIDVWIGSLRRRAITGVICTVDSSKRDVEVKVLLGCTPAEQKRILSIHNYRSGRQGGVLVRRSARRGRGSKTTRAGAKLGSRVVRRTGERRWS